jgi:hypothetical protein
MLKFIKKIFGVKPTEPAPAPYKVEVSVAPKTEVKATPKKKPAVKKATTRKPKTPKA